MSLDLRTFIAANTEDQTLVEGSFDLQNDGIGAAGGKRFLQGTGRIIIDAIQSTQHSFPLYVGTPQQLVLCRF
jgi:hypothetical protein